MDTIKIENLLQPTNVLETWKPIKQVPGLKQNVENGSRNEDRWIELLNKHRLLQNDTRKKKSPDIHLQVSGYKIPIRVEIKSSESKTAFIMGGGNSDHYHYDRDQFEFMAITFDRDSENPKFCAIPWKLIHGKKNVSYEQVKTWENNFNLEGYVV